MEHIRIGIAAVGSYLPAKIATNADLEKIVDTSDEWIVERTGIKERRYVAEGETNSDMVAAVCNQCIEEAGIEPEDIDALLLATITPDRLLPAAACIVQAKIGAKNAFAMDLSAACAGFLFGLQFGGNLIALGQAKNVLVVGCEVLTSITNWTDRTTCVLFGDGAGGVLLQPWKEGMPEVLATDIGSDGNYADMLTIPAGGQEIPLTSGLLEQNAHKVIMDGSAVFKRAVRTMVGTTRNALTKCGLNEDDITWLVPHQANLRILVSTARNLGIPKERVYINVDKVGNTSSASVPIALDEARKADCFEKGDIITMCAFGGGFAWGSSVVRW